jgi:hypothetical protein
VETKIKHTVEKNPPLNTAISYRSNTCIDYPFTFSAMFPRLAHKCEKETIFTDDWK